MLFITYPFYRSESDNLMQNISSLKNTLVNKFEIYVNPFNPVSWCEATKAFS